MYIFVNLSCRYLFLCMLYCEACIHHYCSFQYLAYYLLCFLFSFSFRCVKQYGDVRVFFRSEATTSILVKCSACVQTSSKHQRNCQHCTTTVIALLEKCVDRFQLAVPSCTIYIRIYRKKTK